MKKLYLSFLCITATAMLVTGCKSVVPGARVNEDRMIVFSATGQSIAETMSPLSIARAELAATTLAKANLLEAVKGALITSSVKVDGLMLTEQMTKKTVQGWLARAVVEVEPITEVITEATNLPHVPIEQPKEQIITAVATLTLSKDDMKQMKKFVE